MKEQNTYDFQTAKFIATVCQSMPDLSGDTMQGWIENPKGLQKVLKKALYPPVEITKFPIWKTIKLGIQKSADEYRKAIKADGMKIGDYGNDILGKPAFNVSSDEIEVELVRITVAELGFKNGATRKEIYNKALELGRKLCPNEVGPALRLQYADQPLGEWLLVAMEPITDSRGSPDVFDVARSSSGSWLDGYSGCPGDFWGADRQWVFLRGK